MFKLDNTGHYTVLYNFCSFTYCRDGLNPYAGVIQDAAGNLYGTTYAGGTASGGGGGTIFKVDKTGHETVLYSFCSVAKCTDGAGPLAGLVQDAAGNLYGTTEVGGAKPYGTVFKLDSKGHETVLHSFCVGSCTDGAYPDAGLIQDAAGILYGTTPAGGANNGGTVFKMDTTGNETVLYSFCSLGSCTDGNGPVAGLIQDAAGNLYGTTGDNGVNNGGTVFKVDTTGHETVLYNFCSAANCTDGNFPQAGLIQDSAGNLYGTTSSGGIYGYGTVFKLTPPFN